MTPDEQTAFLLSLNSDGYLDCKAVLDGEFYVGIHRFAFTCGIIIGEMGDRIGYIDRWCYRTYDKAKAALNAWDGHGEPIGWHRHPLSGRRICEAEGTYDQTGRIVGIGEMYIWA